MRLGDVLEQTADASIAARPKPRWRLGRGLLVLLFLSLATLSYVHGPVLLFPEAHERVVLTTQWQLGEDAPAAHYETEETVLFVAPLVQTATRVDGSGHTSRLDLTVATREGIPIALPKIEVRHGVRPGDGHRVHDKLGGDVSQRAALATALTRHTLIAGAAIHPFADLADGNQLATRLRAEEDALSDALGAHGVRLLQLEIETPTLPDAFLDLAQRRSAAQKTLAAAAKAKSEANGELQKQLTKARAEHTARMTQLEAAHREALEGARATLSKAQDAADADFTTSIRTAKGRRAAMRVEAETISRDAATQAKVLAARVDGVGSNGAALLDWVIMNRVIPQLTAPRQGHRAKPDSSAPKTSEGAP